MSKPTNDEKSTSESQPLSLEERILRMAATDNSDLPEFPDDKSDLPSDFEYNPEDYEDQEEEVVEEISETELLKYLDQQENPLSVVQRLFYNELNTTESQKQSDSWKLNCLTPQALEELYSSGWTEVENIIDLSVLKGAHEEAEKFVDEHKFVPAKEFGEDDPYRDTNARDDAILWMDPKNNVESKGFIDAPPHLKKLLDFIQESLHHDLAQMIRIKGQIEYQLSYFHENGAHYERHRDSLPTDDSEDTSQRRVSIVFHLNPGWDTTDGGEIRIFSEKDGEGLPEGADRIIKPLLGRVLIFMSGAIDYEVLPTKKPTFSLTAWMK